MNPQTAQPFNLDTDDTMDPNMDYARLAWTTEEEPTPPFYSRAAFWWPWVLVAGLLYYGLL